MTTNQTARLSAQCEGVPHHLDTGPTQPATLAVHCLQQVLNVLSTGLPDGQLVDPGRSHTMAKLLNTDTTAIPHISSAPIQIDAQQRDANLLSAIFPDDLPHGTAVPFSRISTSSQAT
jgi:hypothetical protein